jgi:nucleoside-diphosphate-sugar epimerase
MSNKVLLTGSSSMIGKQLLPLLQEDGYQVLAPTKQELNCMILQMVYDYFDKHKPDYVIHLAGYNGGISFNQKFPADIYMQTAYMALNVTGAATFYSKKMVSVLPSCAYYPNARYPDMIAPNGIKISEEPAALLFEYKFEDGQPHESVACHGLAKRILFDYSRQLHKQYKFNAVCCVLNNCYGPGARYDEPDRMKVVDSLIKKFCDAKLRGESRVVVWGTGEPKREVMYAGDAAEGILEVFKHYDDPTEVINIGCGYDVSIRELAYMIQDLVDPSIEVVFDTTKPDGQMKKMFDITKMKEKLGGWEPKTDLYTGLKVTIEWYVKKLMDEEDFVSGV